VDWMLVFLMVQSIGLSLDIQLAVAGSSLGARAPSALTNTRDSPTF
jgi:hypothetical protein